MPELNTHFFKTWRERWGTGTKGDRREAEERNRELESLVKDNIFESGPKSPKDVLVEVVKWKWAEFGEEEVAKAAKNFMDENGDDEVEKRVKKVLDTLSADPNSVSDCIQCLKNLKWVGIPVASAFLRFLDPVNHRYGVIDRNVARFLKDKGITRFQVNGKGRIINDDDRNLEEYQKYHNWLQEKAKELQTENATYTDIDGKQQFFKPVDVEMAIFAYERLKKKQWGIY